MKVSKDKFLVEVQDQFQRPNIAGFDFIDTDYNPKILATKVGRIHTLPICMSDTYHNDIKLEVGDMVVFHDMVCQNRNKYQENIFFCDYFNIYAKIAPINHVPPGVLINIESIPNDIKVEDWVKYYKQTGNIVFQDAKGPELNLIPLEEVFFSEPIIEKGMEIGCFKVEDKVSSIKATIFEVSNVCYDAGLRKGDIVYFTKNADYPITIAGRELYRMFLRNVIGLERGGELICFGNKLLVKNVTELGKVGDIQRIYAHNSLQYGEVVNSGGLTGLPVGMKITYFKVVASEITWKGENYSFIKEENIKWIQ